MVHQIMFYGGLAGAILTLITAIILYYKMGIKQAVADLTGRQYHKSASKRKREREEEPVERITNEIKLKKQYKQAAATKEETATMPEQNSVIGQAGIIEETVMLASDDETTMLLENDLDETSLLLEHNNPNFKKELDIVVVHSATII